MSKPTKTINRIHFTDLEEHRFEDLSMQLVYRFKNWITLHPDGRSGNDDGIDIRGKEKMDSDTTKDWFIQCKRYKKVAASELKKCVDEALNKNAIPPDVFLVIVGCDVSLKSREAYGKYSVENGIQEPLLWQAANLETKLYSDHPDLLFAFFGIAINKGTQIVETTLKKALAIKRKLNKILSEYSRGHNIIIHSIDDNSYPDMPELPRGQISPWFKLEFNEFYSNGIEFILNIEYIILEKGKNLWSSKWAKLEPHSEGLEFRKYRKEDGNDDYTYNFEKIIDLEKYDVYKTYRIGRIAYKDIVDIDEIGDGTYPGLHLYCRFDKDGMPYCEFVNQFIDGVHLEMSNEINFDKR